MNLDIYAATPHGIASKVMSAAGPDGTPVHLDHTHHLGQMSHLGQLGNAGHLWVGAAAAAVCIDADCMTAASFVRTAQ